MHSLQPVGTQLREWRQRRRLSQLDLAGHAEVSTRHLSFMETGRALPSREMLLRLAERLEVPLRERNRLLTAAGYAPMYAERQLDDPALQVPRERAGAGAAGPRALPRAGGRPALEPGGAQPHRAAAAGRPARRRCWPPPLNVLRLSLHPQGLAPRIVNLAHWRAHLLHRLQQQVQRQADPALAGAGRRAVPATLPRRSTTATRRRPTPRCTCRCSCARRAGVLSFISTITVFGTPNDITLSELALETFFPADEATAAGAAPAGRHAAVASAPHAAGLGRSVFVER